MYVLIRSLEQVDGRWGEEQPNTEQFIYEVLQMNFFSFFPVLIARYKIIYLHM